MPRQVQLRTVPLAVSAGTDGGAVVHAWRRPQVRVPGQARVYLRVLKILGSFHSGRCGNRELISLLLPQGL